MSMPAMHSRMSGLARAPHRGCVAVRNAAVAVLVSGLPSAVCRTP